MIKIWLFKFRDLIARNFFVTINALVYNENIHYTDSILYIFIRLIPFEILSFLGMPARGWHDSISKTFVVNKNLLDEKKKQFYSLK